MSGTHAFEHFRSAWYGEHPLDEDVFDEVKFGPYGPDGPPNRSIAIRWYRTGTTFGRPTLTVDSTDWPLLHQYASVLQELGTLANQDVTPAAVIEILRAHGFEDQTETEYAPLFMPVEDQN